MDLLENAYIYCFKLDNKIIYIGKSHQPIINRLEQHLTRCHNDKLKEYLESDNPPTFEIIYESHNEITEDILKSIEKSYIETLKPECNKEGVLFPYGQIHKAQEQRKQLGLADVFNSKKMYTQSDIQDLLKNNPQIMQYQLIVMDEEVEKIKNNSITKDESSLKRTISKVLEGCWGKLNDFNTKEYYNSTNGNFQQKVWIVRNKETKEKRFVTEKEKLYGFKKNDKEELVQGRILFYYGTDEDVKIELEELDKMLIDYMVEFAKTEDNNYLYYINDLMYWTSSIKEYLSQDNHLSLYFPVKMISIKDDDNKSLYYYLDTLPNWYIDRITNEEKS